MGCDLFCYQGGSAAEGATAHHARLLMALDRSLAALCKSRGIVACDGLDEYNQHGGECEVGELHTRTSDFAHRLAAALEEPSDRSATMALGALASLLSDVTMLIAGRPRVS